jgi:hypothetical protein
VNFVNSANNSILTVKTSTTLSKDSTPSPQPATLHALKKVRQVIRKVTRFRTVALGTPCYNMFSLEGGCQDAGISD